MKSSPVICFDLAFDAEIKYYIPKAYIANKVEDKILYIEKIATVSLLKSYNIELSEFESKALEICGLLSVENLSKKYNAKNAKIKPLAALLLDKKIQLVFENFYASKMNFFLDVAKKNNLPVSINLNRTIPFFNQHYIFKEKLLKPILHFNKTSEHIVYTLSLQEDETTYYPVNHNAIILLNQPGWIAMDKSIYSLEEINGNKIRPFITKKCVEIQEKNSRTYFETFIKDILKKVEIETEGFQIEQNNQLLSCFITPEHYFVKDVYLFSIGFQYKQHQFLSSDKRQLASKIELNQNIEVFQTKRNTTEEEAFISEAKSLGLIEIENGLFGFNNLKDKGKYSHLEHFMLLNESFKKSNFDLSNFSINQKKLITSFASISASHQEKEDWFDINMQINCGAFSFPFTAIISNLKSQNPVYELEDGSVFIIPNQWFTKYKSLITMGEKKGNLIQIQSNQFPLLEVISDVEKVEKSKKKSLNIRLLKT